MSIKPLPEDVVAQIKSSVVITSLNNVVTGLITNSLDAQASRINVSVDYSRGNCSVEDNGIGIPPTEFHRDGGLGQLHYTSKYPAHPDVHGKHGTFLASVASLSLTSITSHHRDFNSHNSMSIHNSRVLARNMPCLPEQRVLTFAHGTRVTVRDLFGAMPVRVKHRALQAEKSSFTRDWDRLALDVVALLIPWPGAASMSIRDAASRQTLTFKISSERQQWINDSCRLLHQASFLESPDISDWVIIGASSPALSISGYVCREPVATKRAQFISLGIEPLSNEFRGNVLYEEVNKVFADSSFGSTEDNIDTDEVLKRFRPDGFTQRELKTRKGVDRWPMFFLKLTMIPTASTLRPSLNVDDILDDRHPDLAVIIDLLRAMFYEFLKRHRCRPRKVVLSGTSESLSQRKHNASTEMDEFASVASNRKRTRNRTRMTSPSHASMAGAARDPSRVATLESRPESSFAFCSKIKSGHPLQSYQESAPPPSRTQSVSTTTTQRSRRSTPELNVPEASRASTPAGNPPPSRPSLFNANGKLTRKPFDDIDPCNVMSRSVAKEFEPEHGSIPVHVPVPAAQPAFSSEPPSEDEIVEWVNPVTNMITVINARTGFSMAPKPLTFTRRSSEHNTRGEGGDGADPIPEKPMATASWITELISKWKNPVFDLTEAPIPKLPDVVETLGLELRPGGHQCHDHASFSAGTRHETAAMSLQGRISRRTLQRAKLIAQVDKKFIFAKVSFDRVPISTEDIHDPSESSSVLILIDQHAADERCRVEGLMADYFHPFTDNNGAKIWKSVTELLSHPVQFELSSQDRDLLVHAQPYFKHWGIYYEVDASAPAGKDRKSSRNTRTRISVRSLPPAILERCRTDPRLLAELIRTEAWRLKDDDKIALPPQPQLVSPDDSTGDAPVWVALFHGCPPGIVDFINSRACRSAIMFNDPLTLEQCSDILERLLRCAFPFQCAHGRPSMVPLVDLGDGTAQLGNFGEGGLVENRGEGFGLSFKKWKKTRG